MLTKNKRLFRFDSCLTLQNSFFFSFDIVFLLYRFRFFSLYFLFLLYRFRFISLNFVFLLYRFRFISLDFVFLLYRFRCILFSFRFVSFLFFSQFTGTRLIHAKSNKLEKSLILIFTIFGLWLCLMVFDCNDMIRCSMCYWKLVSNGVCVATKCPCLI